MTREEAKQESYNNDYVEGAEFVNLGADVRGLIDKIYDDFESRTCENCKYYLGGKVLHSLFENDRVVYGCNRWEDFVYNIPDKEYGCNYFEIKEK